MYSVKRLKACSISASDQLALSRSMEPMLWATLRSSISWDLMRAVSRVAKRAAISCPIMWEFSNIFSRIKCRLPMETTRKKTNMATLKRDILNLLFNSLISIAYLFYV